jgi:hypothetical protein
MTGGSREPRQPSPEHLLTAVQIELPLFVKRLIACRNRICRETGSYLDDPGAALRRADFLRHDIRAGLISSKGLEWRPLRFPRKPVSIR